MRFLLLAFMIIPFSVCAQRSDSIRQSNALRFADATIYTFSSPARWKSNDWLKVGTIVAGTAALTLADNPVRKFWQRQDSKALDAIHTVGYHYGKPYSAMIFTGGFYLSGMIFKNEWAKETGLILGSALFSAGLLESTLKPLVGRARPTEGEGNYEITFFNREAGFHSFPSGHASMAFTISMVMARRIKSVPVQVLFYSLATTTGVCRLYSDAHWISDVAFGSTIAWFCSDIALRRLQENRFRPAHKKGFHWNVYPHPSGMTVKATF